MSELRQHLVSGDWLIMTPERAQRPHLLLKKKSPRRPTPKRTCPFEDLQKSGNWPPAVAYPNERNWQIVIIPNKYPALRHREACAQNLKKGIYSTMEGVGRHELIVTRDHVKNLVGLPLATNLKTFDILQKHYRALAHDPCLMYVSTFFNWGASAGASLYHPHYQILALPILPPHVRHSLQGSRNFWQRYKQCPHCETIRFELKEGKRVIAKNQSAVALAPFTSNKPFEVRIFPRKHLPAFEKTPARDVERIVAVLQDVLRRVKKHLKDPDFNFFIHTAPLKERRRHLHYHWHIEVVPKIIIPAGFELSTGIDINTVDPDNAAAILRGK